MEISTMTKFLSVAAVLAATAGAQAAFSGVAVDFAAGSPLVASSDYLQLAAQPDDRGVIAAIALPGSEFSSGVWMSGGGIGVGPAVIPGLIEITGRPAELGAPSNADIIVGSSLSGSWLITPAFEASQANAAVSLESSVLVARLSIATGGTIDFASASALVTIVLDGEAGPTPIMANFAGIPGGFGFEAALVQSGGMLEGVAVDTYDVYFGTVIPTPGAVALAGIAGLAGIRRRR